jgi:hypothetical protein
MLCRLWRTLLEKVPISEGFAEEKVPKHINSLAEHLGPQSLK